MIALTVNKVDDFVTKAQRKGIDVRWDGWKMIFFTADQRARTSPSGSFRNGEWGFETVVEPNSVGKWLVDYQLARGFRNARR